ncbi:Mannosyl-oligosaccharide 1,2-alpha-mannosidase IB [Aphanomyces cochlioides]|nr:Mannosyl-oligosaccharide 1,2-alpha-mannosidase IB [Aphanomyces cochlioides]
MQPSRLRMPLFIVCFALFVLAQIYIVTKLDITMAAKDDWPVEAAGVATSKQQLRGAAVDPVPRESPVKMDRQTAPRDRKEGAFQPKPDIGVDETQKSRMQAIRDAMKHAWSGYEAHAFGADEVGPVSGQRKQDVWGDLGVTLVDAIDTLYIMDLADEFKRARDWIASGLDFDHISKDGDNISIFEITIRELGGLLSAFDLSQDDAFKQRAIELADLMLPAFGDGVFYTMYNVQTKVKSMNGWTGFRGLLADIGTLQLELRYLSDISGNSTYAEKGDAFYEILKREGSYQNTGLFPVHYEPQAGHFSTFNTIITIGALGDSFYEYLLKVWLYSGQTKQDAFLRDMYNAAVDGIEKHLLTYSAPDDAYYLQELRVPEMEGYPQQDHLLCFVPGMLALGTLSDTDPARVVKHLDLAKKLMRTCYEFYRRQPTGLAPDIVRFPGYNVKDARYRLRPETVESLMYLFRVTKDATYREWGWQIFQSLEQHAKAQYGYGAVHNVDSLERKFVEDKMESFFLAETLKYHYLLQASPSFLPLDKYVFNTEAHPFSIVS